MDVVFDDGKVFECEREKRAEHIVVIAAEVNDLGVTLLKFLQDDADEAGVCLGPLPGAFELPAIDDVAVEDEFLAADMTEEVIYFIDLAFGSAEVDIRKDDGADVEMLFIHDV